MLKMYYGSHGTDGSDAKDPRDPYNINGATFQPDAYLNKLLKVLVLITTHTSTKFENTSLQV